MGEIFFMVALALIGAAYAFVAALVVWNVIGPTVRTWAAHRSRGRVARAVPRPHSLKPEGSAERPPFHPNM